MRLVKKLFLITSAFIVLLSCSLFSNQAYAGNATGGGFGGGEGEIADRFNWYTYDNGENYTIVDRQGTTYGDGVEQASLRQHANDEGQDTYTRLISYATTRRGRGDGGELRYIWTTKGYATWGNINNWGVDADTLPSELRYTGNNNVVSVETVAYNGILYRISDGAEVSAVWVDPNKEWRSCKDPQDKEVLIYTEGPGTNYDTRDTNVYDAKWQWDNGISETEYAYTTQPGETNVTKTIKYQKRNVRMTHTWEYRVSDGATRNHKYKWEFVGDPESGNKSITYTTSIPSIAQIKYTPLNLNRNGYATASDIGDGFAVNGNTKINASVNNNLNVTDNSPIKSLDINNDLLFTFTFNNDTYGMPNNYDWDTKPGGLEHGSWEDVDSNNSPYCNGKSSSNGDKIFRYDLTFKASTTSLSSSASTSSLVYGDSEEVLANDSPFSRTHTTTVNAFDGNDGWSVRFNLAGDGNSNSWYYTDNGSSDYPYWWVNTYSVSKYYEYGTHYSGKITIDGVQEPNYVSHGNYKDWKITTDAESEERGLYVGENKASYKQPVMTGKWDVKTIAGDLI